MQQYSTVQYSNCAAQMSKARFCKHVHGAAHLTSAYFKAACMLPKYIQMYGPLGIASTALQLCNDTALDYLSRLMDLSIDTLLADP
jgi:hypothetical protein